MTIKHLERDTIFRQNVTNIVERVTNRKSLRPLRPPFPACMTGQNHCANKRKNNPHHEISHVSP